MNQIIEKTQQTIELRIRQAVTHERQEAITRTIVLLHEWGYTYSRIQTAIREIHGEPVSVPAIKMRVSKWRRQRPE